MFAFHASAVLRPFPVLRRIAPVLRLQPRANLRTPTMILERKSAAAVIIGDEILTGKTLDTNTQALAQFLVSHGVVLQKTETIRDDVGVISRTVRQLSSSYDLVFTSGGIGPTLDDVTYEGVSKAFDLGLEKHEDTVRRMREIQPQLELNQARMRMALLPSPCEVYWTEGLWVPLCCVGGNVYVLPGIPKLFARMLESIPAGVFGGVRARFRRIVLCDMAEGDIAQILMEVKERNRDVDIGSYPNTSEAREYRTMITLEGDEGAEVEQAAGMVCERVHGRMQV